MYVLPPLTDNIFDIYYFFSDIMLKMRGAKYVMMQSAPENKSI